MSSFARAAALKAAKPSSRPVATFRPGQKNPWEGALDRGAAPDRASTPIASYRGDADPWKDELDAAAELEEDPTPSPEGGGTRQERRGRRGQQAPAAPEPPDRATALKQAGFGGLAELDQMQNSPLGSTSSLSGPGSRRALGQGNARSLERLARRYGKMKGGQSASADLLRNAAAIRASTPSLRSEAGVEADAAYDRAESALVDKLVSSAIEDENPEDRRSVLRRRGRRAGPAIIEE